jgi:hypothetical protein
MKDDLTINLRQSLHNSSLRQRYTRTYCLNAKRQDIKLMDVNSKFNRNCHFNNIKTKNTNHSKQSEEVFVKKNIIK